MYVCFSIPDVLVNVKHMVRIGKAWLVIVIVVVVKQLYRFKIVK